MILQVNKISCLICSFLWIIIIIFLDVILVQQSYEYSRFYQITARNSTDFTVTVFTKGTAWSLLSIVFLPFQ